MYQWLTEPINNIDHLDRRKRRREGGGWWRRETAKKILKTIAKDELRVVSSGLVFLLICKEEATVEGEDQIPTKQEVPRVSGWGHSDTKQRPLIFQKEVSVSVYMYGSNGGWSWGEVAAHLPHTTNSYTGSARAGELYWEQGAAHLLTARSE